MPMPKPLKIGMITTFPPGKGSLNEYAYHFVRHMRTKAEVSEVVIFADDLLNGEGEYQDQSATDSLCPLTIIPCWEFGRKRNSVRIMNAVAKAKPDVILYNMQFATFGGDKVSGALGLMSPALARLSGIPTIVLLHNIMETVDLQSAGFAQNALIENVIRGFGNMFTRMILTADIVALTIPKYVEILTEKYEANNVVLAPHGSFEAEKPEPSFDLNPGPLQIMSFGKFGTYKKVEPLIEAFEILQNSGERPPLELVIAGTDSPNAKGYLANAQDKYSHVKNMRFTGYVAEEDVPTIFGDSAVVVFPYSSTTGSSGVLHQAGNYGKATVLPNIGDFAEVIMDEGYTGEFFKPDDVESLATAIGRVIDDPINREKIARQNYLASQGLPISEVVDWYIFHFQLLLEKQKQLDAVVT